MYLIASSLAQFLQIYIVLLIIRILLTWFPTVDWSTPPFSWLSQITDPYLNLFRSIIPPLGGMDFSPMLAILLLQVVSGIIPGLLGGLVSAGL
ncbi:MAG: YggT family protein [Timaviella obliquedivisa GSE-PSE-MK23-08B]|jgi:YggT family protein|nr:YggT family protein [Timaviella obliquedivisa GSE-PSE-MK23-08B]